MDWSGQVEALIGDRGTGDMDALAGREWDVCIDNPTTLPSWVRDAGRVLHGKVQHYVFISTLSVYAENDRPADESAPVAGYTGTDAMAETVASFRANVGELYGPLKAVSEQEAKKQFPGMTTIIRPGLIVGPGDPSDRFTYWPVCLARAGDVLAPGEGTDPVQIIDVRDLAEWTIRMAESRTFGTFNATGPEQPIQMRAMLTGIAAAIHSDAQNYVDTTGIPRRTKGRPMERYASVGPRRGRQRRVRKAQHWQRGGRWTDVPPARDHCQRHT